MKGIRVSEKSMRMHPVLVHDGLQSAHLRCLLTPLPRFCECRGIDRLPSRVLSLLWCHFWCLKIETGQK